MNCNKKKSLLWLMFWFLSWFAGGIMPPGKLDYRVCENILYCSILRLRKFAGLCMWYVRNRVSHKRRPIAKKFKVDISHYFTFISSLSWSGIFLIFEKLASFLGNPVHYIWKRINFYNSLYTIYIYTCIAGRLWLSKTESSS